MRETASRPEEAVVSGERSRLGVAPRRFTHETILESVIDAQQTSGAANEAGPNMEQVVRLAWE